MLRRQRRHRQLQTDESSIAKASGSRVIRRRRLESCDERCRSSVHFGARSKSVR
jgi:hypothetical protein